MGCSSSLACRKHPCQTPPSGFADHVQSTVLKVQSTVPKVGFLEIEQFVKVTGFAATDALS
jgi:hypothetical protein